jgi:multiple sugar transport system permease protein
MSVNPATFPATTTPRPPRQKAWFSADSLPAFLMAGPAIFLLLLFLILPFMGGIGYSFTNQRLISANPTEFVGLRNYQRLLGIAVLPLTPETDPVTGELIRD